MVKVGPARVSAELDIEAWILVTLNIARNISPASIGQVLRETVAWHPLGKMA